MMDILLDPDKALDAVNRAVALVKKASQTAQNVESLGPVLGRYFDAKANAIASAQKAKAGGFGESAMGKAIELEMALEAQRQFEEELKGLFFSSGKMDIWQRIVARAAQMEAEAAKSAAAAKRAAAAKKKREQEAFQIVVVVTLSAAVLAAAALVVYELIAQCAKTGCG